MRTILVIALLLAFAPLAYANEGDRPTPSETEVSAEVAGQSDTPQIAPVLTPAVVSEQQPSETQSTALAAQPTRGWLWTVGAIVVAGVILAVLGVV